MYCIILNKTRNGYETKKIPIKSKIYSSYNNVYFRLLIIYSNDNMFFMFEVINICLTNTCITICGKYILYIVTTSFLYISFIYCNIIYKSK